MSKRRSQQPIPEAVLKEAEYYLENYKGKVVRCGSYGKYDAYIFKFEEDIEIGIPKIYVDAPEGVFVVDGSMALDHLATLEE